MRRWPLSWSLLSLCIDIYIDNIRICICIHICIYMYLYLYVCIYIFVEIYVGHTASLASFLFPSFSVHRYLYGYDINQYIYVYKYTYVSILLCMYVYMCGDIYRSHCDIGLFRGPFFLYTSIFI